MSTKSLRPLVQPRNRLQVADDDEPAEEAEPEPEPAPTKKKKNKKKNKRKDTTKSPPAADTPPKREAVPAKDINEMSIEEMTAFLQTQQPRDAPKSESKAKSEPVSPHAVLRGALALDAPQLDPALELRRQFGAAAIKAYEREKNAAGMPTRAGARSRENRGAMFNSNTRARTLLCTPKATWPDIARTFVGLSMTTDESAAGRVCNWVHSRAYRQAQFQFAQAVNSHDTGALMALMRVFPWHIDTLLQLSDVSRYQGDLGQAADFIDRALFAMERSAAPPFTAGLTASSGPPQVDFFRAENRAFWLAGHRNVDLFGRRGTWRTALEWCKLLLGLDTSDPHGMLLWIDFLAIKSKQHAWLLTFLDALEGERREAIAAHGHLDNVAARTPLDAQKEAAHETWGGALDWSVGASFARALALRAVEKDEGDKTHTRSDAALRLALARHPCATALLCEKLDLPAPSFVQMRGQWSAKDAAFDELLAHLYVHRSISLWKEAPIAAWFRTIWDEVRPQLEHARATPGVADEATRMGVYRHVVVADLPEALQQQLMRYFPPAVRNPPGGMETFDPLPPAHGSRYDDAYFAVVGDQLRQQRPAGSQRGAWEILRHLQNLGADELQQLMDFVDPETRDLLLQAHGAREAGELGDVGDVEEDDGFETEEEPLDGPDDDEAPAAAAADEPEQPAETPAESAPAPGLMQRAWNALWG
ncbi:hypothetical protein CBS9595_002269 [Malassezia furfur]|nr:hypothetical protein CBS9595_002269 [Malassezia furfur]